MSFSNSVKKEIISKNIFKNDTRSLLQGLILGSGSLVISNKKLSLSISSENEDVVNFIKQKILSLFCDAQVEIKSILKNFKSKERYELVVDENSNDKILKSLAILDDKGEETIINELCDKSYLKSKESSRAFLTGMFLSSGSVSVPQNDKKSYGYHFEIDVTSKSQADMLAEILSSEDIFPKIVERGEEFVVYIKNSETICDILSLMGASKSLLDLENNKVSRDMNNATNRQVNCMTANIDKTVAAALKQIKAIEIIQDTIGIENLPDNLSEVALLRLANPESSLADLLMLMEKPISKGALAQRFDKILKISRELGENNG